MSVEEASERLPGFPVAELPGPMRRQLVELAEDEFVFDGSPFTLAGCLRGDRPCKDNAVRGLALIARFLQAGASSAEALQAYNVYYRSFDAAQRANFDLSEAACKGPDDAPLQVVEFSDFECPFCNSARGVLESLLARGDVRLCFMHFPLPGHDHSMSAAQAAVFAQRHGKFWELHDRIFDNQRRLSTQVIRQLVREVGLDVDELARAVGSGELTAIVERQKAQGERLGIPGTPAVFVNGRQLSMGLSPEMLQLTLADERTWLQRGRSWTAK